ncbi:hypothetical protein QJS04_geneDACA000846 [Acorus gramineus]|uniref:Rab3-GAP regulatory subunit N-terminal domain-containing protein n=1 Tax=Acorus gramineus TaxID=55184 RepID=A0AAV9BF62_ACOGR|nr:hypothetical protein QJS04_geneDACA000846 [Acorus gramineus]
MAKRSHLSELGCIACDELDELGAGKEGWLVDTPSLVIALDDRSIALARRFAVLVISWGDRDRPSAEIWRSLSPVDGEISAIEWVTRGDLRVLAIGTTGGFLLLYSPQARLIHKQMIYPARILRLRVRSVKNEDAQDASFEDSLLEGWFQEVQSRKWEWQTQEDSEGSSHGKLPCQLWNVSKYGLCADTAITGIMPPPLMELQSRQQYYCGVTIGEDAVISAYRLSEDRSRSLVGTILSKVVPATFSTLASFSKMIWRNEQVSTRKSDTPQPFAKASPLTCLKDHPRKGEKLTLSPSGTLAAITDSLGRILLLDTQALVVVRLWKGYREACCLFTEMLIGKNASASSTYYEPKKSDYCLCLAIHAPRKGIIERFSRVKKAFGSKNLNKNDVSHLKTKFDDTMRGQNRIQYLQRKRRDMKNLDGSWL